MGSYIICYQLSKASTSSPLPPPHINMGISYVYDIPSSSFTVIFSNDFGKGQKRQWFYILLCFAFYPQKVFPTQTDPLEEHHPNCPRQLNPFKLNALQLLVLWLNLLVRERAETVCSSLTAQHITSEIQYIHHILSLQSIIAIKHSLPRWTEKLTLMPKTSVPKRLLLIQKSAKFSHRSTDSSYAECPRLHPPPCCPPYRISLTFPLPPLSADSSK